MLYTHSNSKSLKALFLGIGIILSRRELLIRKSIFIPFLSDFLNWDEYKYIVLQNRLGFFYHVSLGTSIVGFFDLISS
jgi:hypothetical protein